MPEVTEFLPPKEIHIGKTKAEFSKILIAASKHAQLLFKERLSGWSPLNLPTWETIAVKVLDGDLTMSYVTDSEPFIFVDLGTVGPYTIKASFSPFLKFQVFGEWKSMKQIQHPGIDAQNISAEIAVEVGVFIQKRYTALFKKHGIYIS